MSAPVWETYKWGTQTNFTDGKTNDNTAVIMDVQKFMREVVAPLHPTELFIGSAHWWSPTSTEVDTNFLRTLAQAGNTAVKPQGGTAYWKTVTMPDHGSYAKQSLLDIPATKVLTSFGWKVFDTLRLTLKASTQPGKYWNDVHYHYSVHNQVNEALIRTLVQRDADQEAKETQTQTQRAFGAKEGQVTELFAV